ASAWSDEAFLDLVSQRAFMYFLTFTDTLGFAYDRSTFSDLVSVGSIGFQLSAYCIGDERGWADGLEARVEKILRNLRNLEMGPQAFGNAGYRGFFYHFLNSNTGERKDGNVELSLYDTMLLMYGVLNCKEHFKDNDSIQSYAQYLYDAVQWDWMVDSTNHQFYLGWTPETQQFTSNHVDGYTDEALLVDILALGSSTHPVTMDTYHARERKSGVNIGVYPPGNNDSTVVSWSGSLFNYFFADCWLNLKYCEQDNHATYPIDVWENNRRAIQANYQFCIDHQDDVKWDGDDDYKTYNNLSWGPTACDNLVPPDSGLLSEYYAVGGLPTQQNIQYGNPAPHLGTIAVYGAGSSINFLTSESIAALRNYYEHPGMWSPYFGFADAFSTDPSYYEIDPSTYQPILDTAFNLIIHPADWMHDNWVNTTLLGIDEGPMLLTIDNYLHGFVWALSRSNPNISAGMGLVFSGPCSVVSAHEAQPQDIAMTVTPNPGHGIFRVEVHGLENPAILEAFDVHNRPILRKAINGDPDLQTLSIDLRGQTAGFYFVRVSDRKRQVTKKIVVYR
ncbi:MAG: T9SS type A sorting domain-containing protein, partial [Saprospiraceae bacterium]|nr:T9SS type A sorting domain-containing protein [Saprospiraceae bacterium]